MTDSSKHKNTTFALCCVAAVALRMLCSLIGYNYDMDSWDLVSDIVLRGDNVYHETYKYNYGPLWFYILAGMKLIGHAFRYQVSLFLSIVDVLIAFLLFRRNNFLAALFFLFSPISIIISGYHSQFDNLAVLMGLAAVSYAESRKSYSNGRLEDLSMKETIIISLILGVSLITKHILFLFPLWLFFKTGSVRQKIIFITVPVVVFFLSFLPFVAEGYHGIVFNVFKYYSYNNAPLYNMLVPGIVKQFIAGIYPADKVPRLFFFVMLALCGILFRKRNIFESFVFYLACLFLFSSSIVNQYLAIPVLFTAAFPNIFSALYNAYGLIFYYAIFFGASFTAIMGGDIKRFITGYTEQGYSFYPFITLLLLSVLLQLFSKQIKQAAAYWYGECRAALGIKN